MSWGIFRLYPHAQSMTYSSINAMIYHHCDPEGQPHISFFLIVSQMNNRLRLLGEQGCDWMGMVEHEEVCHCATNARRAYSHHLQILRANAEGWAVHCHGLGDGCEPAPWFRLVLLFIRGFISPSRNCLLRLRTSWASLTDGLYLIP